MHHSTTIQPLLTHLCAELPAALPANLVGLYVRGSLATGDFRPASSDIDLLAVTYQQVSDTEFARLAVLHDNIATSDLALARRIEIAYIDRNALRRYAPGQHFPTLGQGEKLAWTEHHANWLLERWMVREQGIALFGPLPMTLIDPIPQRELVEATRRRLVDWAAWAEHVDDPEWHLPRSHKFYVVETMCRALHTLAIGTLASKPVAVEWAQHALPEPWRTLVIESRAWQVDRTIDASLIAPVRAFVLWVACGEVGGLDNYGGEPADAA